MNRRSAIRTLAGAGAAAIVARSETEAAGGRWALQYFYDRAEEQLTINDLSFVSATQGIALGWVTEKKGKTKGMSVVSRNGGTKWELQPLPDAGVSMFFLNESLGWFVGEKALWRTEEGGRDWKKLKLPKETSVNRVYFRTPDHGWAACQRKTVLETKDGGRTWSELVAAQQPTANPDYTSYNFIEFVTPKRGMIVGSSIPPRPGSGRPPWLDPESAAKRREWPSLTLTLETKDGGDTWTSQTAPAFGQATRYRGKPDGSAVLLIRFGNAFEWPAEVYSVQPRGGSTRIFRQSDRVVTDCGWMTPGRILLAAIEPPGRLHQLPIPGKVHMLYSDDMSTWSEMKVDYRAFGNNVMLSVVGPEHAWAASDTGQILRFVP